MIEKELIKLSVVEMITSQFQWIKNSNSRARNYSAQHFGQNLLSSPSGMRSAFISIAREVEFSEIFQTI